MRLPLLLPTQTLHLLPPALEPGKKSVLLTTIRPPAPGRVTPPLRLGPGQARAGVIKFSNPALGPGQQIKVELSNLRSSSPRPLARRLELPEEVKLEDVEAVKKGLEAVKKEVDEVKREVEEVKETVEDEGNEEMSLQCTEKIVDSPSPGKERDGRGRRETDEPCLLQPLEPQEPGGGPATVLAVSTNEFGLIELAPGALGPKKEHVPASPRKDVAVRRIQDDEILSCEGCGCYGMAGEFAAQNSCSPACSRLILTRVRDEARRSRDQGAAQARKEERRTGTPQKERRRKGGPEETVVSTPVARPGHYNSHYPWHCARRGFLWPEYLEWATAKAAPDRLFPEPLVGHGFVTGMKLEAIDPEHQALICVVSVVEVVGHRLRLHFDGYGDSHDFWENADSENLFPAGWCQEHSKSLVPPKGYSPSNFCWSSYLTITSTLAAPGALFLGRANAVGSTGLQGWKIGDRLEALDMHDTDQDLVYVSTVANVMEGRVLIHFDGWSINHDYWARPGGPWVHPVGWAASSKKKLIPPQDSQDTPNSFSWPAYLAAQGSRPVPAWAFRCPGSSRDQTEFRTGQRLEAVDMHNPLLVRVVSIVGVAGRRVRVNYDGWPEEFQVWLEDVSPELHPAGWAQRTGHPLQEPLTPEEVHYWASRGGCPTPGCRGLGHVRGARYSGHQSLAACPYSPRHLEGEDRVPDRLQGAERERIEDRLERPGVSGAAEEGPVAGRGGRDRRKRKFFDESARGRGDSGKKRRESSASSSAGSSAGPAAEEKEAAVRNGAKQEPEEEEGAGAGDFSAEWEDRVRRSVFRPGYLPQPAPPGTLPFHWAEHARLLLGPTGETATAARARLWGTEEVCRFISEVPNIEHEVVAEKLRAEEVDGEALLSLTQADLTTILEIKLGPAIKIFNAITAVRMHKA
jgi:hypothetical protein